ncbi:MAG: PilZ domain-containing protein [Planctomycetia bacterium]|nr:PilZ domain-containing protein [Planctomycetia bacterium]
MPTQQPLTIHQAVDLITQPYREKIRKLERRESGRVEFFEAVSVVAEYGSSFQMITRDISATGIRLLSTRQILCQVIGVTIQSYHFSVRIIWSYPVTDDMFEYGGKFLDVTCQDDASINRG